MPAIPFWSQSEDADAWNTLVINDEALPGIATVDVEKARDIEVKKTKGDDGVNLEDNGRTPADVSITLTIWTVEQWTAWQRIRPKIDPHGAGGIRSPLNASHPELADSGIDFIYIKSISSSAPSNRSGKVIRLSAQQWFPKPKPAKTTQKPKTAETPFRFDIEPLPGQYRIDLASEPADSGLSQETLFG